MIRRLIIIIGVVATAAALVAGCGSSGKSLETSTTNAGGATNPATSTTTTSVSVANYHPQIDPAQFTTKIDNAYFPLKPGTTHVLVGTRDGAPTRHVTQVDTQTRRILGVDTAIIHDTVTSNHSLVEKTTDWYAQDSKGNVWYFGEATAEYANGVVTNTQGSWEAGVDGAQPGIVMQANPTPGKWYRQEYRPGIAEDKAKVLKSGAATHFGATVSPTLHVAGNTFHNVIVTDDVNPLDPSLKENKWYAKGSGIVKTIRRGGGHVETSHIVR
jgi:hypothetical protein